MRIFSKIKDIRSRTGEIHFQRFAIIDCKYFGLYIHKIFKSDKDPYLHSHPWNFASIILKGSYIEKFKSQGGHALRIKKFGSLSFGNKEYFHKIDRIKKSPVYSLFFVWRKVGEWFYDINGEKVHFENYRKDKDAGKYKSI